MDYQWIGLRDFVYMKALYLMGETMVSCRCSTMVSCKQKKQRTGKSPSSSSVNQLNRWAMFNRYVELPKGTWWLIPLSKWVITPVINGISRVNTLIIGVITHLLSGMSHQLNLLNSGFIDQLQTVLLGNMGCKKSASYPAQEGECATDLVPSGNKHRHGPRNGLNGFEGNSTRNLCSKPSNTSSPSIDKSSSSQRHTCNLCIFPSTIQFLRHGRHGFP